MKLKNYKLAPDNHFVAMEYYNLIMNRTFLILLLEDCLLALKVNGYISVEADDFMIDMIMDNNITRGSLENPHSYIKTKYLRKIINYSIFDSRIESAHKSSFRVNYSNLENAKYDSTEKWGMGYYPHDGKVYLKLKSGKKRELIILGSQSGQKIANLINQKLKNR